VSPSEIAFLALGIVLGAAIGAAIVEAVRARPAPRREVRITVSPNSITPRRPATLASADPDAGRGTIPGSPDDDGWLERRLAGEPTPSPNRTRVPSGPVTVPAGAVAVPVESPMSAPTRGPAGGTGRGLPGSGRGPDAATASLPAATAVAILERPEAPVSRPAKPLPGPAVLPSRLDAGEVRPDVTVRPRLPARAARVALPPTVVAIRVDRPSAAADAPRPAGSDSNGPAPADAPSAGETRACEAEERIVGERCRLAEAAREQARLAADTLREARRAYDVLRERVERAQSVADPREIRAAKDALHRAFRAARAAAMTTEAAEQAAREWLNEINRLNTSAREAAHVIETGGAELRALLPRLERLAVEADAARITAEGAEAGCQEAREALARCEERASIAAAAAAAAGQAPAEEPTTRDLAWPTTREEAPVLADEPAAGEEVSELAVVTRILRGDRPAREGLIAALAAGDEAGARDWQLRITALVDAIVARAIEDGFLDLPDTGFWGLFTHRERREVVAALSALGFRFDGLGGFADGRVPAQRDLSLAVGYAGLDRMRIRIWPRESELGGLYAEATVAADEWLVSEAGDLSLGRMVDALGARAAELADLWNAWGRVRPALLATT
jgi:hypothetical protein